MQIFGCWFERRTPRRESEVDAEKGKDRFQENFEKMWFTEVFAVPRSTFLEGIHDRLLWGELVSVDNLSNRWIFDFKFISFHQFVINEASPNDPIDYQVTKLDANLHSSWETFSIQVKFSFSEFSFDWLNLMSTHCFAGTFWDSFSSRVGTISAL